MFDFYDHPFLSNNNEIYNLLQDLNLKPCNNIKQNQEKNHQYYDRKPKLKKIILKDIIYLKSIDKFKHKYAGPCTVVEKHSLVSQGDGTTWEIHLGTRLRVKVVHP